MLDLKIRSKWFGGAVAVLLASANILVGQSGTFPVDKPPPPGALNTIPVTLPANLGDFVVNRTAAIVLGKALFWDQQVGSDGLGCASCHFQAGADNRIKNALDPGLRDTDPNVQNTWNLAASHKNNSNKVAPPGGGPNYTLGLLDFPFHQLADILDRNSAVLADTDDIAGSQGVFRADFSLINQGTKGGLSLEVCNPALSSTFSVHGINTRAVEPRNTPTVINAIFNYRSFFDGRANNIFNGRNPFGPRDPTAGIDPLNSVLVADPATGALSPLMVSMPDASLASQAVGPPGSDLEMSCRGRVFEDIGRKMLTANMVPLSGQQVSQTDSVLGAYSKGTGLSTTYDALIKQAFPSKFWSSTQLSGDKYRQIEKNFSLFFGLSIMLYESTLVSDNSPFDQYASGNISAITTQAATGFQVFNNNGGCVFCHSSAEFTSAASSLRLLATKGALVEHMMMGDGTTALYDSGFYNIGVRPSTEDIGIGGLDPWGNPLDFTREAKNAVAIGSPQVVINNIGPDGITLNTCLFMVDPCLPIARDSRDAVDGAFKVPSLRNVELTGPYFHNGGQKTLEDVVAFYNRGGDGRGQDPSNTTGFNNSATGLNPAGTIVANPTNRAPAIFPLNLSQSDQAALVALLKSLTDERVRWEMAPFDHPGLKVPNGHPGDETSVKANGSTIYAVDDLITIPAVGAAGRAALKLPALQPFVSGLK
jgi:cytochrome c peroxidase